MSGRSVMGDVTGGPAFDPVDHSVYDGRDRLGRYSRISATTYAAFAADDAPLGEFRGRRAAYQAVLRRAEDRSQ
jgi:hypothetical protein